MPSLLPIDERVAPAFLHLTYPSMRSTLLAAGRDPSVLAVGAQEEGNAIALALAREDVGVLHVLSLFTEEAYRGQGIAGKLLASLELSATRSGARGMELTYMTGRASEAALTRVLDKQQWARPEKRMQFLRARTCPLQDAPRWIQAAVAPSGMSAFAWQDLDVHAAQRLRESHASKPWVPPELDPFASFSHDPPFDRDTSLGLLHKGEVVGWMITHRIAADTIRYSQWCIRPDLRRGAAAPYLLAEAIRRQITRTDATKLQLGVKAENLGMFRFLERHLAGRFFDSFCSMGRRKELQ